MPLSFLSIVAHRRAGGVPGVSDMSSVRFRYGLRRGFGVEPERSPVRFGVRSGVLPTCLWLPVFCMGCCCFPCSVVFCCFSFIPAVRRGLMVG